MSDKNDQNKPGDRRESVFDNLKSPRESATIPVSPDAFLGKIPMQQRAYLKFVGIADDSQVIELQKKQTIIGRTSECDIQLPSNRVSRKHACIDFRNEEYHLRDLESTNGVFVNGIRIVRCVLRNTDQIEIGGIKMIFSEVQTIEPT